MKDPDETEELKLYKDEIRRIEKFDVSNQQQEAKLEMDLSIFYLSLYSL